MKFNLFSFWIGFVLTTPLPIAARESLSPSYCSDSLPVTTRLDSYKVQELRNEAAFKEMKQKMLPMKQFNDQPFYQYLKGTFRGEKGILNLSFAHFAEDGSAAFQGSLFIDAFHKSYEIEGKLDEDQQYFLWYVAENAVASEHSPLFLMLGRWDEKTGFNGYTLDCGTWKQSPFEFQVHPPATGVFLDLEECFARKKYRASRTQLQASREYSIVYNETIPIPQTRNTADIHSFLKSFLGKRNPCKTNGDSFTVKGLEEIKATLAAGEAIRNRNYSKIQRNCIYWNEDSLLTVYHLDFEDMALMTYGMGQIEFTTYDLKRQKKMTEADVFQAHYDEKAFAQTVCSYLKRGEGCQDDQGKLSLSLWKSDGYTSKGFYMVGTGNHGDYRSPIFIPYEVVESFLRADFKHQYWKK